MILQQLAERAMQHTRLAISQRRRVPVCVQAIPSRLHSNQSHILVLNKVVEEAHGVASSSNASHQDVRLSSKLLQALLPRLLPDDGVKVPDHHRIWMRASDRPKNVVGGLHVRHPVPNGLRGRVLQGCRSGFHRPHLRAKQPHPENVQGLSLHVFGSHVDDTLEPKPGTHRGRGNAVLACTSLSNNSLLSKFLAHESLAKGVVDFVRTGVVQVLSLQVYLAIVVLRQPLRVVKGRRPADVIL
mmetsp:Transcript_13405/g.25594  ORF Transcript_13405/g.25594 Transcript_13405/m.25594 type:complete len:242 (-) Transcript_13405:371-1096(-)